MRTHFGKLRGLQLAFSSLALAAALGACGGDDASNDESTSGGDAGAGGTAGAGGMVASGTVSTELWTTFDMTEPDGPNGALGPLFNAALQDRTIMVLIQRDDTGAAGSIVRTGSAKVAMGNETADDPTDDVFAFNLEATCADAMGVDFDCGMPIGEAPIADETAGYRTKTPTIINAYSSLFKMVIRLRDVDLEVTTTGCPFDTCATFRGVITVSDAELTVFELVTGDPSTRTDLQTFFEDFGTMPDAMATNSAGTMEPAYTVAGTFKAEVVEFKAD